MVMQILVKNLANAAFVKVNCESLPLRLPAQTSQHGVSTLFKFLGVRDENGSARGLLSSTDPFYAILIPTIAD
jgi:hypothetical protein